jgi:hypothetical protein
MRIILKDGGLTPSGIALRDSLNLKPDTLLEPMMLTPSQQELLRQNAREIVAYLEQSPRLKVPLKSFALRNQMRNLR